MSQREGPEIISRSKEKQDGQRPRQQWRRQLELATIQNDVPNVGSNGSVKAELDIVVATIENDRQSKKKYKCLASSKVVRSIKWCEPKILVQALRLKLHATLVIGRTYVAEPPKLIWKLQNNGYHQETSPKRKADAEDCETNVFEANWVLF